MIRKSQDCTTFTKVMFGGPGAIEARQILNEGEFCDKGRLFNHIVLKPGVTIAKHRHVNDFETYYILKGYGVYNDNGTEGEVGPGDVTICPEGEEPDQYAMTLTYRNKTTGETRKFSEEDYPWQDTLTWEYVSSSERLVKKGYQPPIQDLYIEHPVFGDISTDILESTGYTFLAVARNLDECDTDAQPALNALARWAAANGHSFWGLTSSPRETVARYRDLENTPYDFCAADETQLKTMIRSNPGLILLHGGTIIGKWPGGALPTPERIGATDPAAFCLQEQQHLRREYLVSFFILLFFALYFALPRTRKKR